MNPIINPTFICSFHLVTFLRLSCKEANEVNDLQLNKHFLFDAATPITNNHCKVLKAEVKNLSSEIRIWY